MSSRGLAVVLVSIGALVVLGLLGASPVAGQDVVEVRVVDTGQDPSFAFEPGTVTIEPGDTVRWASESSTRHTVTADDGAFDEALEQGDTFEHTFEDAGTFPYHCRPHQSFMMGTVVVESGEGADGMDQAPGSGWVSVVVASLAAIYARSRR